MQPHVVGNSCWAFIEIYNFDAILCATRYGFKIDVLNGAKQRKQHPLGPVVGDHLIKVRRATRLLPHHLGLQVLAVLSLVPPRQPQPLLMHQEKREEVVDPVCPLPLPHKDLPHQLYTHLLLKIQLTYLVVLLVLSLPLNPSKLTDGQQALPQMPLQHLGFSPRRVLTLYCLHPQPAYRHSILHFHRLQYLLTLQPLFH